MAASREPLEIELSEAVDRVREQLLAARDRAEAEGKDLTFAVESVQLDFAVEWRTEARGGAKARLFVVDVEAGGGHTRGRQHRVTVTLTPRPVARPDGTQGELAISDDDAGGDPASLRHLQDAY